MAWQNNRPFSLDPYLHGFKPVVADNCGPVLSHAILTSWFVCFSACPSRSLEIQGEAGIDSQATRKPLVRSVNI